VLLTLALGAGGAALLAQEADPSGTWRLDRAASRITPGAGLAGLGAGGAPPTLYITQAANGAITVGSDINESQSRIYRLAGQGSIPALPGAAVPVTSRWDGRTLIVDGAGVKERLALSADGSTLTISVTVDAPSGTTTSTLVYGRMQHVDPCTNWPTPCRN
jgi:hypothetical protein